MNYRESDSRIVFMMSIIIRLTERRRLHNIALNKETSSIHRDRRLILKAKYEIVKTKLLRITEISKNNPKEKFTSIYHLINEDMLMMCHKELDGNKATGIDNVTKREYAENLENNIKELVNRLRNKAFIPAPAKRVNIPKANGKTRPLGIAIYEDKIVQLALKKIIEAIYEPKFLECMNGFRPNKGCHTAIKQLSDNIERRKVGYIVDADIKGFFNNIDHNWLMKCLEQHIQDPNILKLVKRFLKAGIIENGTYSKTEVGTPQGSILSPVLANIYMHYVLALWFEKKVKPNVRGEAHITIYADDYVCGFQYRDVAELFFNKLLPERLAKFNLQLEPSKTRLIEFGRFAEERRKGKRPETFDFLGFTFYCGKNRNGKFNVKKKTSRKKYISKIKEYNEWCKNNRHLKVKDLINKTNIKLQGHYRYFGIEDNYRMIKAYKEEVRKLIFKWLNRRSQRKSCSWEKFGSMSSF